MIPSGPQLVCDFKFSLPMLFCLRVLGPSYLYFFLKPCTALSRDSPVLRGIVIDSRASISQATSTSSCASRKLERTQYRHVLIIRNLLASGVSISGAIALSLCLLGNSFHKKLFTFSFRSFHVHLLCIRLESTLIKTSAFRRARSWIFDKISERQCKKQTFESFS
eukprot:TRINITY_DN3780_c0_g1_i13.p1 TRINITY_DN3780_c0_g1~~TRINITY_DN3780_c0_g1_i13.p1  ORF type:complete len:165 (+),score=23.03 TRINITY_DN3780_c0_g1_i13:1742-2236(+)